MTKSVIALFVFWCLLCTEFSYAKSEVLASFGGQIDLLGKKANLDLRSQDGRSLTARLEKIGDGKFQFDASLEHITTPIFDISSVFRSTIERAEDKETGEYLRGTIESKYSLINYKPASELSGLFEIRKERIYLKNLSWNGFVLDGFAGLVPPYEVNMTLRLSEISLEDLSLLAGCKESNSKLNGTVSGRIQFSGFPERMMLSGKLTAFDGAIDQLLYDDILINFEGLYPMVKISDSSVSETSGLSFNIEGDLDLRYQCNLMMGLAALKMSPIINENVLHREWTIKRSKDSERSATEFKYRLQKDNESGASQKDSDMFSIEHNIAF